MTDWRSVLSVALGDLGFICPPPTAPFMNAWDRGDLRRGLCAGGLAPLIKTVIALPGQRIGVARNVAVDGTPIPAVNRLGLPMPISGASH